MKLTFENNKFVLQRCPRIDGTLPLGAGWQWDQTANTYQTKNIHAAVKLRKFADGLAERIFSKHMLTDYPLPPGGAVCPASQTLLPFQRERGVPHILATNKTYLAHQPGLGKSAQFICAVNTKPGQALILCPSFLKITWAREITKWYKDHFPSIAIVPESEKRHEMNWNADFIICSDAMLLKDWVRLSLLKQKFRFIGIDEGHRFKEAGTSRTVALFGGRVMDGANIKLQSPGLIYSAEHVTILSGTPMLNRPIELWPMLFAMAPELIDFMPYQDFGFRYGGARQDERGRWLFVGSSNEDELHARIMGRFMQRICKADVLEDLPDKVREVIIVDHDTRDKQVVRLDQELVKKFSKSEFNKPKALGDYALLRHVNGLAKVKWAAKFVFSLLSSDETESIILFAHHRDVVEELKKLLFMFAPKAINGGVSNEDRTAIEDDFQSGRSRLLIGNIDAMNLGLTLTRATRVVFCEYSWTPSLNEQAEDRAHRIGQKDSVFCQYLVLPNSIDEVVLTSILKKEDRISKVIEGVT